MHPKYTTMAYLIIINQNVPFIFQVFFISVIHTYQQYLYHNKIFFEIVDLSIFWFTIFMFHRHQKLVIHVTYQKQPSRMWITVQTVRKKLGRQQRERTVQPIPIGVVNPINLSTIVSLTHMSPRNWKYALTNKTF